GRAVGGFDFPTGGFDFVTGGLEVLTGGLEVLTGGFEAVALTGALGDLPGGTAPEGIIVRPSPVAGAINPVASSHDGASSLGAVLGPEPPASASAVRGCW